MFKCTASGFAAIDQKPICEKRIKQEFTASAKSERYFPGNEPKKIEEEEEEKKEQQQKNMREDNQLKHLFEHRWNHFWCKA